MKIQVELNLEDVFEEAMYNVSIPKSQSNKGCCKHMASF